MNFTGTCEPPQTVVSVIVVIVPVGNGFIPIVTKFEESAQQSFDPE